MLLKILFVLLAVHRCSAEEVSIKNKTELIRIPTPEYYISINNKATLNCSELGENFEVEIPEGLNYTISGGSIEFKNITKEHTRQKYRCYNKEKEIVFDKHPILNLVKTPDFLKRLETTHFEMNIHIGTFFGENANETDYNLNCTFRKALGEQVSSLKEKENIQFITNNVTKTYTLVFRNLKQSDSGRYACTLENEFGSSSSVVDVQVRAITLALWPFLVICAQVIICSIGILIFEKSFKKKQSDQYEIDQQYFIAKSRITTA
ncbi:unnamed protein product [Brachionus calyciflorus]|uniref:Ig-like domain-containing protein n=1 Tax=Brachionus calyciflorus TaxID=104777 RepID=A0A813M5D7_9BILA|nr:unnamed protein product [Brachionus calyciflorus]